MTAKSLHKAGILGGTAEARLFVPYSWDGGAFFIYGEQFDFGGGSGKW